jgi:hypothetical protein
MICSGSHAETLRMVCPRAWSGMVSFLRRARPASPAVRRRIVRRLAKAQGFFPSLVPWSFPPGEPSMHTAVTFVRRLGLGIGNPGLGRVRVVVQWPPACPRSVAAGRHGCLGHHSHTWRVGTRSADPRRGRDFRGRCRPIVISQNCILGLFSVGAFSRRCAAWSFVEQLSAA